MIQEQPPWTRYPADPVGYARHVLGVTLIPIQEEILKAVLERPYRVMVNSGHSLGKSFVAAVLINWWFDSFPTGVVITTAPTKRSVVSVIWAEVRLQRQRVRARLADYPMPFIGPKAPELWTSDDHWAAGYTASMGEAFQGRHREHMLFIFDEADALGQEYWDTTSTMHLPEPGHAWVTFTNPVSTTSPAYLQETVEDEQGQRKWHVYSISALEHPNVDLELAGQPPQIPTAVRLAQVYGWLADWSDPVPASEVTEGDFEFPPGSGKWYRPSGEFEGRVLGRRPTSGAYGVWSEKLWRLIEAGQLTWTEGDMPAVGCDTARQGEDMTAIFWRRGPVTMGGEYHNGWTATQIAERLMNLAEYLAAWATGTNNPSRAPVTKADIPIRLDDDGTGNAVADFIAQKGYCSVLVNAATLPQNVGRYPNKRSELWFKTADLARKGGVDISKLPRELRQRLKQEAMAPIYQYDNLGRRVVEKKEDTREKLGRSPDCMDALNLCYYDGGQFLAPTVVIETSQREHEERVRDPFAGRESSWKRRGLFGARG